jgi:hypothetical protein
LNGRLISGFFFCVPSKRDGRTDVCLLLPCRTCFINGRGVIVLPEKKTTFLFDFICFLFLFGVGEAEEEKRKAIPFLSSGDSIAFSKHTSIPPAPIPFLYT